MTQLPATVDLANDYSRRASYLAASWSAIWAVVPGLLGLKGGGASEEPDWPNLWTRWPALQVVMLVALIPLVIAWLYAARARPLAVMVGMGLLLGTPLVVIGASQLSPGFALRTVLPATLGWSLIVASALSGQRMPTLVRVPAVMSCLFLVVASVWALPATYGDKDRVLRMGRAAQTTADVAPMRKPLLTFSTGGMDTDVIDAFVGEQLDDIRILTFVDGRLETESGMTRWQDRGPTRLEVREGKLRAYLDPSAPANDAFWFFTHRQATDFHRAFAELGYEPRMRLDYSKVYVSLWALPGADLGSRVPGIEQLSVDNPAAAGWTLPEQAELLDRGDQGSLLMPSVDGGAAVASWTFGDAAAGLYSLDFSVRSRSDAGRLVVLHCLSATGDVLAVQSPPDLDDDAAPRGLLHVSILCPDETDSLAVHFGSDDKTAVEYSDLRLFSFPLPRVR